jgi:protein subunit release factor A
MIPPEDLKVEKWPPTPIGGQHVGTGSPGVKVTHKPTGIAVFVDTERASHRNKAIALDALAGALTSPHFRG